MKRVISLSIAVLLLPVFSLLAQGADGSAIEPATTSTQAVTSAEIATSSIKDIGEVPSGLLLPQEEVAQPKPTLTPVPTPSAVVETPTLPETFTQNVPENSGLPLIPSVLGILTLALGGYFLFKLSNKNKSFEKEDKKDKSRCFDIKKIMDKKLEEITDLKGQLEGKVKNIGKEKVREILAETKEGDLLALIETGEKEYNRLKQLFNECVIEFNVIMKKRVIIVHGWSGSPDTNWLPWLKVELQKLGYEVVVPDMHDTDNPVIENWVSHLAKVVGTPRADTYFVGHSIGCQTILRYLETAGEPLGGAVFVAGWFNLENMESEEEEKIAKPWIETPIDLEKVKKVLPQSTLIISDNDPYGAFESNKKKFRQIVTKEVVLHKAEHITDLERQEVLSEVVSLLK